MRRSNYQASAPITIKREIRDDSQKRSLTYRITVSGTYNPGYPPAPCSNHDSPLFSDPGEGSSFECEDIAIEEILDADGNPMPEDDERYAMALTPDQICLTTAEEDSLYSELSNCTPEDYEPDEAYYRDEW